MSLLSRNFNITIIVISALLFVPFLGMVHLFDWDEINFAECAREMIVSGNYFNPQMNFKPFWEKPPLFIWMGAISMKLFGVNEFAARFPNAICGIITLVFIFRIGKKLYGEKMGIIWSACYAASILPQFYFRSGIIDPWFNLFIFSAIYYLTRYTATGEFSTRSKLKWLVSSGLLTGLAVLTKGPAALIIVGLCAGCFFVTTRFRYRMPVSHLFLLLTVTIFTGGLWFILLYLRGQVGVIENFISYQVHLFGTEDGGHGGPFYYHFIVLLFGCFPASVFALAAMRSNKNGQTDRQHFHRWMLILFWVVLLLFSIVKTKIVHYSSLCYFPLTYLSAVILHQLWEGTISWKKWMSYLLILTGGLFSLALTLLPLITIFKERIIAGKMINDEMALENLKADVHWNGFEWVAGFIGLASLVACLFFVRKKNVRKAIVVLLGGSLIMTSLASIMIAPKIEGYTQGAVIEFHESMRGKKVYVEALSYWSYAQYFYTQKMPPSDPVKNTMDWLLHGELDRDAYFVSKITDVQLNRESYPQLEEIARKNGFVFYIRRGKIPSQSANP